MQIWITLVFYLVKIIWIILHVVSLGIPKITKMLETLLANLKRQLQ